MKNGIAIWNDVANLTLVLEDEEAATTCWLFSVHGGYSPPPPERVE